MMGLKVGYFGVGVYVVTMALMLMWAIVTAGKAGVLAGLVVVWAANVLGVCAMLYEVERGGEA